MLNDDHENFENDPELSGIEFIPLSDVPSLDGAAFSLFESEDHQVVKTPFGMIKISINISADMGDLAGEIKNLFTSGFNAKGLEKLSKIIAASPEVAAVIGKIPGLQQFLDMALEQMKGSENKSGRWRPGQMTWQRFSKSVSLN